MKKVIIYITAVITVLASLTACNTTATKQGYAQAQEGSNSTVISVFPGSSNEDVRRAILWALANREWKVESNTESTVIAKLDHRGIKAHLNINYNQKQITILSDSYDENGKKFVPVRWIANLEKDIGIQMATKK